MAMIGNDVGAGAAAPAPLGSGKVASHGATGARSGRGGNFGAFDAVMADLAQDESPDASSPDATGSLRARSGFGRDSLSSKPGPHASTGGAVTLRGRQVASEPREPGNRNSLASDNGGEEAEVAAAETKIGSGGQRRRGTVGDELNDAPTGEPESNDIAVWADLAVSKALMPLTVQGVALEGENVEAAGVECDGLCATGEGPDAVVSGSPVDETRDGIRAGDMTAPGASTIVGAERGMLAAQFDEGSLLDDSVTPEQVQASLEASTRQITRGFSTTAVDEASAQPRWLAPASDRAGDERPATHAAIAEAPTRLAVLTELRRALAAISQPGVDSAANGNRGSDAIAPRLAEAVGPRANGAGKAAGLAAALELSDTGSRSLEQGDAPTSLTADTLDTVVAATGVLRSAFDEGEPGIERSAAHVGGVTVHGLPIDTLNRLARIDRRGARVDSRAASQTADDSGANLGSAQRVAKAFDVLAESAGEVRAPLSVEPAPVVTNSNAGVPPQNRQFTLSDPIATADMTPPATVSAEPLVSDAPLDSVAAEAPALVASGDATATDTLAALRRQARSANAARPAAGQAGAAAAEPEEASQLRSSTLQIGSSGAAEQARRAELQSGVEGHRVTRVRGRQKQESVPHDGVDVRHGESTAAAVANVAKPEPEGLPDTPSTDRSTAFGTASAPTTAGTPKPGETTRFFERDAEAAAVPTIDATVSEGGTKSMRRDAAPSVGGDRVARPSAHVARAIAAFHAAALAAAPTQGSGPSVPAVPGATFEAGLAPEVHAQFVDAVRLQAEQGGGQARITLNPAFLGELEIDVRTAGNSVIASVHASNAEVREWMRTNETALRQSLADQGLSLDQFVVADDESERGHSRGERESREQDDTQQQWRRRNRQTPEHSTFEVVL